MPHVAGHQWWMTPETVRAYGAEQDKKPKNSASLYEGAIGQGAGKNAAIVVGIILAESGGNPLARNVNKDGSVDRGLFQINNAAHPDVSDACAYSPLCAWAAARRISKGWTDFSPWTTYRNGEYLKHLPGKNPAGNADDAGPFGVGRGPGADTVVGGAVSSIGDFIRLITSGDTWLRIGKVLLGVIALILGIRYFARAWDIPTPSIPNVPGRAA